MSITLTDWMRSGQPSDRGVGSVRARLDSLERHGFAVLHAIPTGARDCEIDHLIIGPSGVYAVNTKLHAGRRVDVTDYSMTIAGSHVAFLRNAKFEAERAASLLAAQVGFDVPVRGCVVLLTGGRSPRVTYESRPIGVSVLTRRDVPSWFRRRPSVLPKHQVTSLVEAARRSSTWS